MNHYNFSFHGRQTGALGIRYDISETYIANNFNEAVAMLYTDYEHISLYRANKGKKAYTQEDFKKAASTNTQVQYNGKGAARK